LPVTSTLAYFALSSVANEKKFYNIELQEGLFQDNSEKSGLCGKTSRQLHQEVEK
jgi:hypothetical protein